MNHVTNDSKNLYISIKTANEQDQIKILRGGMVLWIDTLPKAGHQVGIFFPLPGIHKPNKSRTFQNHNMPAKHNMLLTESDICLKGFKYIADTIISQQNNYGISASLSNDSTNTLYYKCLIPFRTFSKDSSLLTGKDKIFNFTFIVNAISGSDDSEKKVFLKKHNSNEDQETSGENGLHGGMSQNSNSYGGGGSHGRGGNYRSGGNGEEIHGNGHSEHGGKESAHRTSLNEETIFKIRLTLAAKP